MKLIKKAYPRLEHCQERKTCGGVPLNSGDKVTQPMSLCFEESCIYFFKTWSDTWRFMEDRVDALELSGAIITAPSARLFSSFAAPMIQ